MDAKTRAEKILEVVGDHFENCDFNCGCIALIASQIEETVLEESKKMQEISELRVKQAEKEAVKQHHDNHHCYQCHDLVCADDADSGSTLLEHIADCFACKEAREQGFKEGLERRDAIREAAINNGQLIRDTALEEAAKVVEANWHLAQSESPEFLAEKIRALKSDGREGR